MFNFFYSITGFVDHFVAHALRSFILLVSQGAGRLIRFRSGEPEGLACIALSGVLPLLIISSTAQAQQDPEVLPLQEAITIGLENNFDIKITENERKIATNNHDLGNAGFLPILDADFSRNFQVEDANNVFANSESQEVENAQSNTLGAGVNLEWTIFDGTRMFVTYNRLSALKTFSELQAREIIANTVAAITSAYYTVILEREKLQLFQNNLSLSDERLEIAEAKYRIGKASKLEYLAAQVDYNADQSAMIRQTELIYNAKADLNTLLARNPDIDFEVPGQIDANLELSKTSLKESLLATNPTLLQTRQNREIAALSTKELETGRLPEIFIAGGYRFNDAERGAGFLRTSRSSGFNYGLGARVTLFDGWNQQRDIQNAKITEETAVYQVEQTRNNLVNTLEKTFVRYTNSIDLIELETENLAVARENADIALERYKLGKSTSLELREAQRNALEAESRLIDAVYATKIAEIELNRLSGDLVTP